MPDHAVVALMRPVTAPDERVRRSRARVLDAATELLFERGFSGVSVDEIVRRSGVAKTTIYRHWPTRAALLRDACAAVGTPQNVPDRGNLAADLTALVISLAGLLRSERWTSVLPSVIDAAERDPNVARMYAALQTGYAAPFEIVMGRAVRRGELPAGADPAFLTAALIGPLFYRRWFSREPLTEGFALQTVRHVLAGLAVAEITRGEAARHIRA